MNYPQNYTDRALLGELKITLQSHQINQANSKVNIKPKFSEFVIEVRYCNKFFKEMATVYVRLKTQYKYKYKSQTVLSARFDKQDKAIQTLDETEFFINLKLNPKLTETDIDNTDIRSPLERQLQQQEVKDTGCRFDKINSRTAYSIKIEKLNGTS